jgi:hypothetical protein
MKAVSWGEFEQADPDLARFGLSRLDGKVAYLATVREDGLPRAHPVTPVIGEGYCFIFVEPSSPKARDLLEKGFYCLHCSMNDSSGSSGEFQVTGIAEQVAETDMRKLAESVSSFRPASRYVLFELKMSEVLSTSYHGSTPSRRKWATMIDHSRS